MNNFLNILILKLAFLISLKIRFMTKQTFKLNYNCSYFFLIVIFITNLSCQNYEFLRNKMVKEQIESRGIKNKDVLEAMKKVERHRFVPKHLIKYAYEDRPLPIGYNQTISQPYIVAFMTEAIEPNKNMRVLEIGTGSGYQTAILCELVKEVYTIEIIEPLYKKAKNLLINELKYKNVKFKLGNGYLGWEEYAPYDAIVVTAAPEEIPPKLIEQLKDNGKMIIPVGKQFNQYLVLVTKKNNKIEKNYLLPVLFVKMLNENELNELKKFE